MATEVRVPRELVLEIEGALKMTPGYRGDATALRRKLRAALSAAGPLDGCEMCLGAKGGVPGNGNLIGGHLLCDYCTSLWMDIRDAEKKNEPAGEPVVEAWMCRRCIWYLTREASEHGGPGGAPAWHYSHGKQEWGRCDGAAVPLYAHPAGTGPSRDVGAWLRERAEKRAVACEAEESRSGKKEWVLRGAAAGLTDAADACDREAPKPDKPSREALMELWRAAKEIGNEPRRANDGEDRWTNELIPADMLDVLDTALARCDREASDGEGK